jgi:hypothetical protein
MKRLLVILSIFSLVLLAGCQSEEVITSYMTMDDNVELCVQYGDFSFSSENRTPNGSSNCTMNEDISTQILIPVDGISMKKGDKKTLQSYARQITNGDGLPSDSIAIWLQNDKGENTRSVVVLDGGRMIFSGDDGNLNFFSTDFHPDSVSKLKEILNTK